jgi:hypothetical protein
MLDRIDAATETVKRLTTEIDRRATAAVFRWYMLKPVGEPYDSTVAYIEAHYLVD